MKVTYIYLYFLRKWRENRKLDDALIYVIVGKVGDVCGMFFQRIDEFIR